MEVPFTEHESEPGSVGHPEPTEYKDMAETDAAFLFEPPVCTYAGVSSCFLCARVFAYALCTSPRSA